MNTDQKFSFRLCVRQPRAKDFLDALVLLPSELKPEFWFELEPNPKSRRLYLNHDFEAYRARMSKVKALGTLRHKLYDLSIDGYLAEGPTHDEESAFDRFWIHDRRKANAGMVGHHWEPSIEMEKVCTHFLKALDPHYAVYWNYDLRDALGAARIQRLVEEDAVPDGFDPENHPIGGRGGGYADAKISFPNLGWRTVLSDELLTDYGLTHDLVADYALEATERGHSGSGRLVEYRFFEHFSDWPEHIDRLAELCHLADRTRLDVPRFRAEIVPRRWHRVQHWPKWIKNGQVHWPGPA